MRTYEWATQVTAPMQPLNMCINTQTPLVQFTAAHAPPPGRRTSAPLDLAALTEGVDYRYSPGGVTRMVLPLVRHMLQDRFLDEAHWVALNPNAPATVRMSGVTLHSVTLGPKRMASYGMVKEAIWGRVHGIDETDHHDDLFWTEAFSEYAYYNRITSELIRKLDKKHDFDVFYIHDFQQIPIGHMLTTLKPKIFRWHIPFDRSTIPPRWHALLATYLNSYDAIVVSSPRYADSLKSFGYTGRIEHIYPYVDPKDYSDPPAADVASVSERFGVRRGDIVALVVARMDPVKAHDRAIEALAELASSFPRLKLVLVGNGSFSSSRSGVGLSKSDRWRAHLEEMVTRSHLEDRVVFTGHLSQHDLDCFYERCSFTILPSVREGFGLVVVESWLHHRPAIITSRAGIADLVREGKNGLVFDPDEPGALAGQMRRLLGDHPTELSKTLIRGGSLAAEKCSIEAAVRSERALLTEVMEA
ncbi:MAG: glycosyltransferase family 4 protein [Thermoplasmata archaeon]|nr:glycosyltransferase family 4 protein [Thermoplasmata archaeon]